MEASSSFAISYQQQISEQYWQQAEAVAVAMPPASSSAAGHKRKRNHPGTPNPDAEVIALSPKTLMATNRFICEVCNKGFQREQNLQLHRRGHNLPWKLKQKSNKDVVKKKVYLCPETTCIHHDPARALGDLTGIKKHYFRKHGEKKFKCDKCSKRYAVQSDWKAHSKNCGTREYRCDCGTLFSRRDSFITHRAFCDALAQETARHPPTLTPLHHHLYGGTATTPIGLALSQCKPSATTADSLHLGSCGTHLAGTSFDHLLPPPPPPPPPSSAFYLDPQQGTPISDPSAFNLSFFAVDIQNNDAVPSSDLFSTTMASSILNSAAHHPTTHHMSATALLQKATQMGSTSTTTGSTTFLRSSFTNNINDNIHNSNFHDLMNSLSACPMDSRGSVPASLFACDAFGDNNNNTNNNNYNHEISKYGSGYERGGKRLTRDFLGVGEIVRSMNGGGLSSKNTSQQLSGCGSGGALP